MVYVENPLCTVPDDKGNGTSAGRLGRERRCQGKVYLIAISLLGKYAFRLLEDYRTKKSAGIKDPVFTKNRLKEVEKDIECW